MRPEEESKTRFSLPPEPTRQPVTLGGRGCLYLIGLAALLTGEEDIIQTFRESILTLAQHQGPQGEIPSNVDLQSRRISYGGTTGRVDANLRFVIGSTEYWRVTGDDELMASLCLPTTTNLQVAQLGPLNWKLARQPQLRLAA